MKIETRLGLWTVRLSSGVYSDFQEYTLLFSGNTRKEIINSIKVYFTTVYKEGSNEDLTEFHYGLRFENKEIYQFKKIEDYLDFNPTDEYNIWNVTIKNANIIFTKDEIAQDSLYINKK